MMKIEKIVFLKGKRVQIFTHNDIDNPQYDDGIAIRELTACFEACKEILEYDEEGLNPSNYIMSNPPTAKDLWDIVRRHLGEMS